MAVESVQRGATESWASDADTSFDVTITSVVTAQSIVRFFVEGVTGGSHGIVMRGELVNSTTLRFTREGGVGQPTVYWEVIEFDSATSVQHVAHTSDGTTSQTATISSFTAANTWVEDAGTETAVVWELPEATIWPVCTVSGTTLTMDFESAPNSGEVYQIAIVDCPDCDVQVDDSTGNGSKTISAVVLANSEIIASREDDGQLFTGALSRVEFTSTTAINHTDSFTTRVVSYVLEWTDGSTVQTGSLAVGEGGTADSNTISSVDMSLTSVASNVAYGWARRFYEAASGFTGGLDNMLLVMELTSTTNVDAFISTTPGTAPENEYWVTEYAAAAGGATVDVAGTAAAVSTGAGSLSVGRAVAGQADAVSTGAGAASVDRSLSGAASSVSTAAGAAAVARALAGQAVAVSVGAGDTTVSANVTFAGTAAAVSTGAGALEVARPLAGAAAAASTGAGALAAARALSGQAVAVSVGAGDTTVTASGITDVAGQSVAVSAAGGSLSVARQMSAGAVAASAAAGALSAERSMVGAGSIVSAAVGVLSSSADRDLVAPVVGEAEAVGWAGAVSIAGKAGVVRNASWSARVE